MHIRFGSRLLKTFTAYSTATRNDEIILIYCFQIVNISNTKNSDLFQKCKLKSKTVHL